MEHVMNIIASDLGKYNSVFCFYDSVTREHSTAKAVTDRGYFRSVFASQRPDLVVVEACGPSGWVSDLCEELKIPILVCSTHEDAWLFKNVKRKTDKDDAIKLAELAAIGRLKPTHVPNKEMRERKRLIKYRKALVGRVNKVKNTIRAIFANQGIKISSGAKTWHTGRVELEERRKPLAQCEITELWRGELDLELTQLDAVTEHLKQVDGKLETIAKSDTRVQRVMQINGVGRVTAEAIVAYIDDPHRFKNANQIGAYVGLVPRQYQSGNTDRFGRITKRGPGLLRTLLVECAWCSLQYNTWARQTYDRIHHDTQARKKKAAIALARKILIVAWAMMRDETDYDPERNIKQASAE
jgi:transposase